MKFFKNVNCIATEILQHHAFLTVGKYLQQEAMSKDVIGWFIRLQYPITFKKLRCKFINGEDQLKVCDCNPVFILCYRKIRLEEKAKFSIRIRWVEPSNK